MNENRQKAEGLKPEWVDFGRTYENRSELTKGFLSQLERDLTSPNISALENILEALGTN